MTGHLTSLEAELTKRLLGPTALGDLINLPLFVFTTTDWSSGRPFYLTSAGAARRPRDIIEHLHSYGQGPPGTQMSNRLARAVSASAAFPVVFRPVPYELGPWESKEYERATWLPPRNVPESNRTIYLMDGGVADNRGLFFFADLAWQGADAQQWIEKSRVSYVLTFDARGEPRHSRTPGLLVLPRVFKILYEHKEDLIARVASGAGRLFGVRFDRVHRADPLLAEDLNLPPEVLDRIARIRTDLDSFTSTEIHVLAYAGYRLAIWAFANLGWLDRSLMGTNQVVWDEFCQIMQPLVPLARTEWHAHLATSGCNVGAVRSVRRALTKLKRK